LTHLSTMISLQEINFSSCINIRTQDLSHISELTNLRVLILRNINVSSEGLVHLSGLLNLQIINFAQFEKLHSDEIKYLSNLINLYSDKFIQVKAIIGENTTQNDIDFFKILNITGGNVEQAVELIREKDKKSMNVDQCIKEKKCTYTMTGATGCKQAM